MKSALIVLAVATAVVTCHGDNAEHSQPVPRGRPVWLLPGYHHTAANGIVIDFASGRIWKDGGPDISYEISVSVGEKARVYAKENPRVSLTVVESPPTGEMVVALDEDQAAMVVSIDRRAHFSARNVRSRKDVVEVILIATSAAGVSK